MSTGAKKGMTDCLPGGHINAQTKPVTVGGTTRLTPNRPRQPE